MFGGATMEVLKFKLHADSSGICKHSIIATYALAIG